MKNTKHKTGTKQHDTRVITIAHRTLQTPKTLGGKKTREINPNMSYVVAMVIRGEGPDRCNT